jgi:hypothetical protein
VTLPPGRAKLSTKPLPTGSPAIAKTMGMTAVACFKCSDGVSRRHNDVDLLPRELGRNLGDDDPRSSRVDSIAPQKRQFLYSNSKR